MSAPLSRLARPDGILLPREKQIKNDLVDEVRFEVIDAILTGAQRDGKPKDSLELLRALRFVLYEHPPDTQPGDDEFLGKNFWGLAASRFASFEIDVYHDRAFRMLLIALVRSHFASINPQRYAR